MTVPQPLSSEDISKAVTVKIGGAGHEGGWEGFHLIVTATLQVLVEKGYLTTACVECGTPLTHHSETLCDGCEMEAFGKHG